MRSIEICPLKVRSNGTCPLKVRSNEKCPLKACFIETCPSQVGFSQVKALVFAVAVPSLSTAYHREYGLNVGGWPLVLVNVLGEIYR